MATVAETATVRNHKAYHCTYLGLAGILPKPADQILFLEPESGAVITLAPEEVLQDVVILGAVADAIAQYIDDMTRGGAAVVCCSREQEVR